MEWIKNKNLKQSFFIITALFLSAGLLLAALSFYLCLEQGSRFSDAPGVTISLQDDSRFVTSPSPKETNGTLDKTPHVSSPFCNSDCLYSGLYSL